MKQVSLQRPQSPRESGSALDQVPRLTPVPAAVPVSKHASAFMHLYYCAGGAQDEHDPSCDPVHLALAEGRRERDVFGIRPCGSGGAGRSGIVRRRIVSRPEPDRSSCERSNAGRRDSRTMIRQGPRFSPRGSPRTCFGHGCVKVVAARSIWGSRGLQLLFDSLRRDHSLIILDCASRMGPEATALARYCDGSVLVVAAGKTSQSEIASARRQIERVGGQVVGLVLNRERGRTSRRGEEFS